MRQQILQKKMRVDELRWFLYLIRIGWHIVTPYINIYLKRTSTTVHVRVKKNNEGTVQ